jgi:hypothetical protein
LLVLAGQGFKGLVLLLVDHSVLLDPADLVFLGSYPQKAAAVLKHLELLAVDHLAYAVGNGRDAVVDIHLPGGNPDGIVLFLVKMVASGGKAQSRKGKPQQSGCRNAAGW